MEKQQIIEMFKVHPDLKQGDKVIVLAEIQRDYDDDNYALSCQN